MPGQPRALIVFAFEPLPLGLKTVLQFARCQAPEFIAGLAETKPGDEEGIPVPSPF